MRKLNFKIKMIITAALATSSLTIAALGIARHKTTITKKRAAINHRTDSVQVPACDPVLLSKMISMARSLDFNQPKCTYAGIVDMEDKNDTTNNSRNLGFLFCRSGDHYYYRLGSNEVIHQGSLNILIQNEQHKVVLSRQAISVSPPVVDLALMGKNLQSEGYTLTARFTGRHQTLSIINEEHLSIKEISVSLDTISKKLERIYIRQSDFGSPQDKHLDRITDVRITKMDSGAAIGLYPDAANVIQNKGGKQELTGKYKDYELIIL